MQISDLGYGIVPECLSNHECEEIVEVLSADVGSRGRAGARHLMKNPVVSRLANDNRGICGGVVGPFGCPFPGDII
jgi:hypothetical protein